MLFANKFRIVHPFFVPPKGKFVEFLPYKNTIKQTKTNTDLPHYEKLVDLPYNLPQNWVWTTYGDIGVHTSGKTPKPEELSKQGTFPYFKVAEMNLKGNEKYLNVTNYYLDSAYAGVTFPCGAIVLTNKKRILGHESVVDMNIGVFMPNNQLNHDIFMCFSTIDFRNLFKGGVLPTLNRSVVEKLLVPIPPLDEQERIVNAVNILLNQVELLQE